MESETIHVEGTAPGGFKGSIGFRDNFDARAWLLFILIVLQGILVYIVLNQEADRERRYTGTAQFLAEIIQQGKSSSSEHALIVGNQKAIIEAQRAMTGEQRIQTYVLTLDEKQRKGLNLQEPEGLRNRR
jgi:hypothetical protein